MQPVEQAAQMLLLSTAMRRWSLSSLAEAHGCQSWPLWQVFALGWTTSESGWWCICLLETLRCRRHYLAAELDLSALATGGHGEGSCPDTA